MEFNFEGRLLPINKAKVYNELTGTYENLLIVMAEPIVTSEAEKEVDNFDLIADAVFFYRHLYLNN